MSNLGKPDRQLWYESRGVPGEELPAQAKIKFLFGDILELMLLFLAKVAGHDVRDEQGGVEVDGIFGSIDAVIDGVVVDIKSASTYAFKKFDKGLLAEDDPFGYYEQLAGYSAGKGDLDGAWLAIDKTLGKLALLHAPAAELRALDIRSRIEHLRGVLDLPRPPERCYEAEPMGQAGNMKLGVGCSYCQFKNYCWSDVNGGIGLRTFLYSTGPVFLTEVQKEPNVIESTF